MPAGTKVAFSASLLPTGEQNADINPFLAYKHVFTNAGNAYNPDTGNIKSVGTLSIWYICRQHNISIDKIYSCRLYKVISTTSYCMCNNTVISKNV